MQRRLAILLTNRIVVYSATFNKFNELSLVKLHHMAAQFEPVIDVYKQNEIFRIFLGYLLFSKQNVISCRLKTKHCSVFQKKHFNFRVSLLLLSGRMWVTVNIQNLIETNGLKQWNN